MHFPITMKSWGFEIEFINTRLYCYKLLVCVHGRWSSKGNYHYHLLKDETFMIIKGKLELAIVGHDDVILSPRQTYRVFPTVLHKFRSVGKSCMFYEISTQHKDDDSIRVEHG